MKLLGAMSALVPGVALAEPQPTITVGGYLEAFYQVHFQNPDNRITNLRGFDDRSRTFTLSNVAVDLKAVSEAVTTRVVLQVGQTPSTYYAAEPGDGDLWKYIQTATLTYRGPVVVEAGLFTSPIGPEVIPIKDNMNWSRSNLFFALPFYHTGARVSKALAGDWTGTLAIYNGWNSVVVNNGSPSVAVSIAYATKSTTAQLLYFGGIERESDWRNLFDALVQTAITDDITLAAQLDGGFEPNAGGTSAWLAAAGYAKYALSSELYVAARADYFAERRTRPIFWPARWLASGTLTLAYQPAAGLSVRLEARHDQAASDVFFGGEVAIDPSTMAFIPDRDHQDTVTFGATAWF